MKPIVIKNKTAKGDLLQATFLPEKGMNMISFKKNEIEVIDQSTKSDFEERFDGLGTLIGPHFHHRFASVLPPSPDEALFPHAPHLKKKGIEEPFAHGICRYAPWKAESTENEVKAILEGNDEWKGVKLKDLEGQGFKMTFDAEMEDDGLNITMSVTSDSDSLLGLQYHYALDSDACTVISDIFPSFEDQEAEENPLPEDWNYEHQHLTFPLNKEANYYFRPLLNPLSGNILLKTGKYQLRTIYNSTNDENCWFLHHPQGASYACIAPMSAKHPRRPQLTVSFMKIKLQILDPEN